MEKPEMEFSAKKTLVNIVVYFLLFLAGDLCNSVVWDLLFSVLVLPVSEFYVLLRMSGNLLFTCLFFWAYTEKVLHLKMRDFGISFHIKSWGVLFAVLLSAFVVFAFLLIGKTRVNALEANEIIWMVVSSVFIALKAGILEEMLFRGVIMRLLENRWNKCIAILLPSLLFGLAHIPSMETFTVAGIVLLVLSGTLVGVMFSLVTYKGNSIANSVVMHAVWNFVMITSILHITTQEGYYGNPVFSIIIPSGNILLTGAGFGVEASIIAILGYACICAMTLYGRKK